MDEWLKDKKRVPLKGISLKNAMWDSELERASKSLGRTATVNYFLLTRLGIQNCRTMMLSARKQRDLCYGLRRDLKKYEVDPKWDKAFDRDIKSLWRRCDYIYKIVQENLKLTEYWPYFESEGFDRLLDFESGVMAEKGETLLDDLLPEIDKWTSEHKAEVEAYMESVRPEIERKEKFLARKQEAIKAEKDAEKTKKKAEKEEKKACQKFEHDRRAKEKIWERQYESMVRHAGGWNE